MEAVTKENGEEKNSPYSKKRKNRARVMIFDIGWGPGCGVGGPGGEFLNVNSRSGLPLRLLPLKPPPGLQKPVPGPPGPPLYSLLAPLYDY